MEITITTPSIHDVTSRDQTVKLDIASLSADILANIFAYGVTQVIADSASGAMRAAMEEKFGDKTDPKNAEQRKWAQSDAGKAKAAEHALAMMERKVESLVAGDWTTRGPALGTRGTALVRMLRALLDKPQTKAFNKLSWSEQVTTAQANADANPDHFTESAITSMIETIEAERKARAEANAQAERERLALAEKVTITI